MSFDDIPDHIKQNYERLIADRGWTTETAAANYEHADPRLAAYLRSLGTKDPKDEPKGRRGTARSQVAAAAKTDGTAAATADSTGEKTADADSTGEKTADADGTGEKNADADGTGDAGQA